VHTHTHTHTHACTQQFYGQLIGLPVSYCSYLKVSTDRQVLYGLFTDWMPFQALKATGHTLHG